MAGPTPAEARAANPLGRLAYSGLVLTRTFGRKKGSVVHDSVSLTPERCDIYNPVIGFVLEWNVDVSRE